MQAWRLSSAAVGALGQQRALVYSTEETDAGQGGSVVDTDFHCSCLDWVRSWFRAGSIGCLQVLEFDEIIISDGP